MKGRAFALLNTVIRVAVPLFLTAAANCCVIAELTGAGVPVYIGAAAVFVVIGLCPGISLEGTRRMRVLDYGARLLWCFLLGSIVTAAVTGTYALSLARESAHLWILPLLTAVVAEFLIFLNGIIRIYCTSHALGLRWRVTGAVFGAIFPFNLLILLYMLRLIRGELRAEHDRAALNAGRAAQRLCATRYPILLVHGVFFRDSRIYGYWGRIPDDLACNGAAIYFGDQQSAASVESCGREIAERIIEITDRTGCGKVNIIAHSKGGLDSRYAIAHCPGVAERVASLTTVNTPHRGCLFADRLLDTVSHKFRDFVASRYNAALRRLGDHEPDFLAAVTDLTASSCAAFNESTPDCDGIIYRSIGSKMSRARSGRFPLNVAYPLVRLIDGENDGLVAVDSSKWGESFTLLEPIGKRGISHADVIDLGREDVQGFDVREFYVEMVSRMRESGL